MYILFIGICTDLDRRFYVGIPIPGDVLEPWGCDTEGHGGVGWRWAG